jgi:RNA polymerase sigma factor for flagellar operon FliA
MARNLFVDNRKAPWKHIKVEHTYLCSAVLHFRVSRFQAFNGRLQFDRMGRHEVGNWVRVTTCPSLDDVVQRVVGGLDMVERMARRMSRCLGARLELEELLSAGREGLLDAARRFDQRRGLPFAAYASLRIRGAMLDSVRRMAGLPRRAYERALRGRSGGDQPEREIALLCEAKAASAKFGLALHADYASPSCDPEAALERAQLLALIREGLGTLARDEAELVRRHYFEGERIDDIGRSLGITRPWAGRILARAVARLTRHIRRKL